MQSISEGHSPLLSLKQAPTDQMFGLTAAYRADSNMNKVDIGVGAFRDDDGKPWVLPVVKKAIRVLSRTPDLNHEYQPIAGVSEYLEASQKLVLGNDSSAIRNQRVVSLQTLSGTGAIHLASRFLARAIPPSEAKAKQVWVSNPPYANHLPILHDAGLETDLYPYYSWATKSLDWNALLRTFRSLPDGAIVLLQACAHNPTGTDPTQSQWREIGQILKDKNAVPFFDLAYQGFASGDLDHDAWPVRHFISLGFDAVFIAQSYAKNLGLYGERAGCLHIVTSTSAATAPILSQLQRLQRVIISTPPAFPARIVSIVLNDETLFGEWKENLHLMSSRLVNVRRQLRRLLQATSEAGKWDHITQQIGMFCFSGLSSNEVAVLRSRFHIYMTKDGRISLSGLNSKNIHYVAEAIKAVEDKARL